MVIFECIVVLKKNFLSKLENVEFEILKCKVENKIFSCKIDNI